MELSSSLSESISLRMMVGRLFPDLAMVGRECMRRGWQQGLVVECSSELCGKVVKG